MRSTTIPADSLKIQKKKKRENTKKCQARLMPIARAAPSLGDDFPRGSLVVSFGAVYRGEMRGHKKCGERETSPRGD